MKTKKSLVLLFAIITMMLGACTLSQIQKDPARVILYSLKQEWIGIREYVITNQTKFSQEDFSKFHNMDTTFQNTYDIAVMLYLSPHGQTDPKLDINIEKIKNLILKARAQFYK